VRSFKGFVAITRGGTIVVGRIFLAHTELLPKKEGDNARQFEWGRTIGCLERSLFFTLVLLDQWVALGLVVAVKAWRGGPPIEDVREEYYRSIGFMASILVAVVVGVLVRALLTAP
jgi:hypothetical protein